MMQCKVYFNILLGVTHECDGGTDILIANALLYYIVQPVTNVLQLSYYSLLLLKSLQY